MQKRKRWVKGNTDGVEPPPIPAGTLKLGYSDAELPTIRTRLQTTAANGGDRELFVQWRTNWNTIFSGSIVGTNYYSVDAGMAAMTAADFYMLDPEDASWAAAGLSWASFSAVNTKVKCAQLADEICRLSTYHRNTTTGGVTCLNILQNGASNAATSEGLSEPVHIFIGTATMCGLPVWYVWERIRATLTTEEQQGPYQTAMVSWISTRLPVIAASNYPNTNAGNGGFATQVGNQPAALLTALGSAGARVLLGTGVATGAQETLIDDAFQKAMINRLELEYENLHVQHGMGQASMNEATVVGNGYANDNASAPARMQLMLSPHTSWQGAASPLYEWFQGLPESILQGILPGTNFTTPLTMGWAFPFGESELYQTINQSGIWLWLCGAACARLGLTTQARQMKWLTQNFCAQSSISGVSIPSAMNATGMRTSWVMPLMSSPTLFGLSTLAVTTFTTRNAAYGRLIQNEMFSNPTRGSFVMFFPMTHAFTSRPSREAYAGSLQVWTRGSWVMMRYVGGGKGVFGLDNGTGQWWQSTTSKAGFWKLSNPSWIWQDRGYTQGFPNTTADPSMALAQNAADFVLVGDNYARDPDHSTGFYASYEKFWDTSAAARQQQIVFERTGKDLVVAFLRATPSTGFGSSFAWTSPVHLDYHDGTTEIPDHYLQPGVPAKGAWLSSDATTFVGSNQGAAFTASHRGVNEAWPARDAKWFATVVSAAAVKDYRLEYLGYDATFASVLGNNLESQLAGGWYGRNDRTAWTGVAMATADGSTTIALNDNPPVIPNITRIALSVVMGTTATIRNGTYDAALNTFTVTGGGVAAGTYNYDLIESETAVMNFDANGDGNEVRLVCGDGSARVLSDTAAKVEWAICLKLGAATDGAFTDPPAYAKFTETDVWGIYDPTDAIAFVVARANMPSSSSGWLDGYDFLLPTTSSTECQCADLRPGVYGITRATEGGTSTRVTIDPMGVGFTVGSSGRIVITVSTGGVVLT